MHCKSSKLAASRLTSSFVLIWSPCITTSMSLLFNLSFHKQTAHPFLDYGVKESCPSHKTSQECQTAVTVLTVPAGYPYKEVPIELPGQLKCDNYQDKRNDVSKTF